MAPDTASMYRRLASLASAQGLDGPLTRVGDRSARIFWRNVRGAPVSLRIRDWPGTLERSRQIVFQSNPLAQLLMKTGALPADQPD